MVYWFCRDDDLVTTRCILKQSFIIFTTYNSLLTAFISLLETAFRLAFKKAAFTTLIPMLVDWPGWPTIAMLHTKRVALFGTVSSSFQPFLINWKYDCFLNRKFEPPRTKVSGMKKSQLTTFRDMQHSAFFLLGLLAKGLADMRPPMRYTPVNRSLLESRI